MFIKNTGISNKKICLRRGKFPGGLKTAKTICVHKGGAHDAIYNYRPIFILRAFAVILEKRVARQLHYFFEQNSSLTNAQYGFRMGMSTESPVCNQIELIVGKIDEGKIAVSVFLDLAKVFDL